jgi:hypothetical protein
MLYIYTFLEKLFFIYTSECRSLITVYYPIIYIEQNALHVLVPERW